DRLLAVPEVQLQYEYLRLLEKNRQYLQVMLEAENYLSEYPFDMRARRILARTLRSLGRLRQAALQFSQVDRELLEPREIILAVIGKALSNQDLRLARRVAISYSQYDDDYVVKRLADELSGGSRARPAKSQSVEKKEALPLKEAGSSSRVRRASRRTPVAEKRFKELELLHNSGQFSKLIGPAQEYLSLYPWDKAAILYLTTALLVNGDYVAAAMRLNAVESLPLDLHERLWIRELRNNLVLGLDAQQRPFLGKIRFPKIYPSERRFYKPLLKN
ncbi:MAG TPA: hypothetical protein PLL10_10975, partial [Elusimicrobiales bacterium]|nr:hypothetical protein [Elusimicrobiales bacterium]